jgi:transposase
VPIVDPDTGVVREAEIFVAVLGASSLTYALASLSLPDSPEFAVSGHIWAGPAVMGH